MAVADPRFVRLPERLLSGNWTDLTTGFGVSGLDVKEFPEDPDEIRAVREALREQKLEPATQADYDRVQQAHERVGKLATASVPQDGAFGSSSPWNEAAIASVAKKEHKALVEHRFRNVDEDEEESSSSGDSNDYASMHKAELQAEVRRRNQGREEVDQLDENGTKQELVAALQEDDATQS